MMSEENNNVVQAEAQKGKFTGEGRLTGEYLKPKQRANIIKSVLMFSSGLYVVGTAISIFCDI